MITREGQLPCHFPHTLPQTGLTDGLLSRRGEDLTQSSQLPLYSEALSFLIPSSHLRSVAGKDSSALGECEV